MTTPLCYETQRETFSVVTTGFDDKLTVPPDPVLQTSLGVIIVSAGINCLLLNETLSPKAFSCSAFIAITRTYSDSAKITALSAKTRSVISV